MAEKNIDRRRSRRYPLSPAVEPTVEFNYPNPQGDSFILSVTDISNSGFAFRLVDGLRSLEVGTSLDGAILKMGDVRIACDLMVMHVTEDQALCGVLFYPSSDEDLIRMRTLLTGIRAGQD